MCQVRNDDIRPETLLLSLHIQYRVLNGFLRVAERESVNKLNRSSRSVSQSVSQSRGMQFRMEFGTLNKTVAECSASQRHKAYPDDDDCCDFNNGELANNSLQLKLHCSI